MQTRGFKKRLKLLLILTLVKLEKDLKPNFKRERTNKTNEKGVESHEIKWQN